MSLAKSLCLLVAIACAPSAVLADEATEGGASRWATFEKDGEHLFALSLQAAEQGDFPRAEAYEVVVLFDTSATQTGTVRIESMEVLDELAATLPVGTSVSLMACDVEPVPMSDGMVSAGDSKWVEAVARLQKRIPLGTTNLGGALRAAIEQFSDQTAQRSIVYIGDGINRSHFLDSSELRELMDGLKQQRIAVSALAIGPVVDVATLASFSNQTGGVVYSREVIDASTQEIGRNLGLAAVMPVIWVEQATLPQGLSHYLPQDFPPLRLDRDTVVVGSSSQPGEAGRVVIEGRVAGEAVELTWQVEPEDNHPDMAFLEGVISLASRDGGLTLPALGSEGLRAMSHMLADTSQELVRSGRFALKAGQVESAIRIAEQALKNDPNNAEAESLLNAAKKVRQEQQDDSVPAGKFMQTGADPFADDPASDASEQGADPAATDSAPAANPFAQDPQRDRLGGGSILDETFNAGDLLAEEQARRESAQQALEQDVRQSLRSAQEQARRDPTGVKNSLKLLLEELDNMVEIDPGLRERLRSQVRSQIQRVAVLEAEYMDRVERAETIRAQANAAERLLAETHREDETLKQLVEQFNYLMSQHDYLEASKDVAPEIERIAPQTPLANITRIESSIASNFALVREAFRAREQGFVDAMRGVEEAAVPFDGNPPVVYPPPEVWKALTARRKERYGSINLAGGNDAEQRIYAALKEQLDDATYTGQPLSQVMQILSDDLNIPIWIDEAELELLGVDPDTQINLNLTSISVRSVLRLMLEPLDLTYIVRDEVLQITSADKADEDPINKVYPVGDLVVPPTPMMGGGMMGGMGGMMGGMGGMGGGMGGMGGMMGGMGGMGGGMGGMGGMGMGGMGGGMGGGMFAVPDDAAKKPLPKRRGGLAGCLQLG
jgi:tetratricopeptide (TPR) repeat protein